MCYNACIVVHLLPSTTNFLYRFPYEELTVLILYLSNTEKLEMIQNLANCHLFFASNTPRYLDRLGKYNSL